MSKNEFLNALSTYLDSIKATQVDEDSLKAIVDDYLDEALDEYVRFGDLEGRYASKEDLTEEVEDALDEYDFDRPIENYLSNCDFITQEDLDYHEFVADDDFDSRCGDWADDYLNDRIDDWADDNLEERVDSVVNTYDWELVLSGSAIERRIKKLEAKVAMYEILEVLDSIRG